MTRLNWNRPRRAFQPWYDRAERVPAAREPAGFVKVEKRSNPEYRVPEPVVGVPAGLAGALGGKAVLQTRDLAKARQSLCLATEAAVWCDGSASPNPGPIGLGCVIVVGGERVEICAGGELGTNNQAELGAALLALGVLPPQCRVTVYADSQYLVFGITKWVSNWRRKDFKRGDGPIPNADLWRQLDEINSSRSIRWEWVRGHASNRGNVLADRLATLGRGGGA